MDNETGLYHNGFRDYDPKRGAYVQPDPIGLAGGMNPYSYAGGDPINFSDPTGLKIEYVGSRSEKIAKSLMQQSTLARNLIDRLNADPSFTVRVTTDPKMKSGFYDDINLLNVNPFEIYRCKKTNAMMANPELVLYHEMEHAHQYYYQSGLLYGFETLFWRVVQPKRWGDAAAKERAIILGNERIVARDLGITTLRESHNSSWEGKPYIIETQTLRNTYEQIY